MEANQMAFNRWLERNLNCDACTQMECYSEIKINDPSSHERLRGNVNASCEGTDLKSLYTAWFQLNDMLKNKTKQNRKTMETVKKISGCRSWVPGEGKMNR